MTREFRFAHSAELTKLFAAQIERRDKDLSCRKCGGSVRYVDVLFLLYGSDAVGIYLLAFVPAANLPQ